MGWALFGDEVQRAGRYGLILEMVDVMGWILRMLRAKEPTLNATLSQMGELYADRGVGIDEYGHLLHGVHDVLTVHFQSEYTAEIRYAVDEVIAFSVQRMTGKDLKFRGADALSALLNERTFEGLEQCMASGVGREYLYRYLHREQCAEIVLFLQLMQRYRATDDYTERLLLSMDITTFCVDPQSAFAVDLSTDSRTKVELCGVILSGFVV